MFVQRLAAATFLLPNQLMDKILLRRAIPRVVMVSAELRNAYQFCFNTKALKHRRRVLSLR
jgi:hypothetical protein